MYLLELLSFIIKGVNTIKVVAILVITSTHVGYYYIGIILFLINYFLINYLL